LFGDGGVFKRAAKVIAQAINWEGGSRMHYYRMFLAVSICFATHSLSYAQTNGWKGIIPLKSTRAEVERLLGKPIPMPHSVSPHIDRYKTKDG
jgi:hypothetical protein